jgi:uncharacterized protein YkwD
MPTNSALRRALIAASTLAAIALPAAPATAGSLSVRGHSLVGAPCLPGLPCAGTSNPTPACGTAADEQPSAADLAAAEQATLCLVNRQRVAHGRRKLRSSDVLHGVARSYAQTMVTRTFFSHVSPTGSTFDQRIRDAGYLKGAAGWSIGENLAWGGGPSSTPREIVRAWMHSPEHRRNILDGHFRDAGLGIAIGLPVPGGSGATYANEFGTRTS